MFYENAWALMTVHREPSHQVGGTTYSSGDINIPEDPEYNRGVEQAYPGFQGVHYFDGLTRHYFGDKAGPLATPSSGLQTCTFYFSDYEFDDDPTIPIYPIQGSYDPSPVLCMPVTNVICCYNGTAYDFSLCITRHTSFTYEFAYSLTGSLKVNGWSSGTSAGSVTITSSAYLQRPAGPAPPWRRRRASGGHPPVGRHQLHRNLQDADPLYLIGTGDPHGIHRFLHGDGRRLEPQRGLDVVRNPDLRVQCGNGAWSTSTNTFTPADGSTPYGTVQINDWLSIYSGSPSATPYIAQVTGVATGTNELITLSSTYKFGTAPTTGSTFNAIDGGAWAHLGMLASGAAAAWHHHAADPRQRQGRHLYQQHDGPRLLAQRHDDARPLVARL